MFISDVKGELYLYTATKLKELGYDTIDTSNAAEFFEKIAEIEARKL